MVRRVSEALARFIPGRSWWVIGIAVMLTGAAIPGISMLQTETGFNAMIPAGSELARDNARFEEQFGAEPITVILEGRPEDPLSPANLNVLGRFEAWLRGDERYRAVFSPLTVLQAAADQVRAAQEEITRAQDTAADQAREAAAAQGLPEAAQEEAALQARGAVLHELEPHLQEMLALPEASPDNPAFVAAVLRGEDGQLTPELRALAPDDQHLLIAVTPRGNMDDEEALGAARDIETFFAAHPLSGAAITVIADSKLVHAISTSLGANMGILFGLSVVVMLVVLLALFRVRWRLLSLLMVGIGALWTFGIVGYASVPLTMTTMAVLPVLIGLGIDYSIQFHNRYQEEITRRGSVGEAILTSLPRMLPVVGIALVATVISFVTLYLSEVPMVRDFGMMLAVGVVLSFLTGVFLLHAILYRGDRRADVSQLSRAAERASGRRERVLAWVGRTAIKYTLPIFIVSALFAVAGGIVDQWLPTNTDYEQLMPQDMPELVELRELRAMLGGGSEIRFMVEAEDVTAPAVLGWLLDYQSNALRDHAELTSVDSLAVLVDRAAGGMDPTAETVSRVLEETPALQLERLVSSDRRMASVTFGTGYLTLQEIHELFQALEAEAPPPAGVRIAPVGTLALGASTMDAVVGSRLPMNLLCLGAVFVVLLLVYRRFSNAVFTIVPVGAVIAWASMDMYLLGIPLNPLTAVMGVLVVGIGTEFMVLLLGRYEEEKRQGQPPRDAMVTAITKIGQAIAITALTTLGGFAVLIASDFVMVRDFGIATVLGVALCLISALAVMPGLIVWFDQWRLRTTGR